MSYANTRKVKREKKESKNMHKKLFITIHHYDKQFFEDMNKIHDPRCQAYITYPLEVMMIIRMLAYYCYIQSMAEMNDDFNQASVIKNVSEICGVDLEKLPHGDTINDLFVRLDMKEFRVFLTTIVKKIIQSRFFEKISL